MPTARGARGIDIVAYSRDATRFLGLQVKTLSKRKAVPLGVSLEKVMGDFWIIININRNINRVVSATPSAFILLPSEVKERAQRDRVEKGGQFWLEPKDYDQEPFREAWDRLDGSL